IFNTANGLLQREWKTTPTPGLDHPKELPFQHPEKQQEPPPRPNHHCTHQSHNASPLGFLWRPQQVLWNPRTSSVPWHPSPQPTCFGVYIS
ncbi:hypothetical protein P7K49_024466, partial [Saguinus oedipus]